MADYDQYPAFLPPPVSSEIEDVWPPPEWATVPEEEPGPVLDPNTFPIPSDFAPQEEEMVFSEEDDRALVQAQDAGMVFSEEDDLAMTQGQGSYPPESWTTPDVVSGGNLAHGAEPMEHAPEVVREVDALADPYETLAPAETSDEVYDMYSRMSSEGYAKQISDEDEAKRQHFAEREADILQADREAQREIEASDILARNEAARQSNELRQDVERLAEADVDPGRWMASRTGLQKAAAYLTAALGGFVSPMNGGRNRGLEQIMRYIDQDIDAQKHDIANQRAGLGMRKSMLAELRTKNKDQHQADDTARVVRLRQAAQMVANEAERYDPAGTAARRAIELQQQLLGEAAARQGKIEETIFDRTMKIADQDIKRRTVQINGAKAQWAMDKDQWEMNRKSRRGGPKKGVIKYLPPDKQREYAAQGYMPFTIDGAVQLAPGPEAAALRAQAPKGDVKDQLAQQELKIKTQTASELVVSDPSRKGAQFTNEDGTVFEAKTTDERKRLTQKMGLAQKAQNAVDKMKAIRSKGGGSSEIIKSAEYQQMMQLVTKVDLENAVAMGLGAISADDFTHLKNLRGGADATSFIYDAMPGLEAMAQGFADDVNIDMRGQQYTGSEQWSPTRKNYAKALERSSDELLSSVGDPVPEMFRGDKHERAKYIRNVAENIEVQASRKERRGGETIDKIDSLPDYVTDEERDIIGIPLVKSTQSVAGRIEAIRKVMKVDGMSKAQRLELQKDPAFMARLEKFGKGLKDSGAFKGHADLDVYQVVTGKKKGGK